MVVRDHIGTYALIAIGLFICSIKTGNMIINEAVASQRGKAYLDIVSEPSVANVYVNGRLVGKTPITGLEISVGDVTIMGQKSGFGTATRTIQFRKDQLKKIKINLTRRLALAGLAYDEVISKDDGKLMIINSLGPVEVKLDGKTIGKGSVSLERIDTGPHILSVGHLKKKVTVYRNLQIKVRVSPDGIQILNDPQVVIAKDKKPKEASRKQVKGFKGTTKKGLIENRKKWLAKISEPSFYENTMWKEVFPYKGDARYHKLLPNGKLYYTSEIPANVEIKPEHWQEHSRWDRWHISQGRLVICPRGDCIYWELTGSKPEQAVFPNANNKAQKIFLKKR